MLSTMFGRRSLQVDDTERPPSCGRKLAFNDTDIFARIFAGMSGEDPREEVGVSIGVVECGLYKRMVVTW